MVNRTGTRRPQQQGSQGAFTYVPRTAADVKERAERRGGNFDMPFKNHFDTYRPKSGESQVRILYSTFGDHKHFGYKIFVHDYVGADSSTYLCPFKMERKPCPICQAAKESADAGDEDEATKLKVKEKYIYWVVDRDDETNTRPKIYMVSWTADRDIAARTYSDRTGAVLPVDHPEKGYDLIIKKHGSGQFGTKYQYDFDREARPIHDDPAVQAEIINFIGENPLPSTLKMYDAGYLETAISGTAAAEDPIDDDGGETSQDYDHEAQEAAAPAPRTPARTNGPTRPAATQTRPSPLRRPAPAPAPVEEEAPPEEEYVEEVVADAEFGDDPADYSDETIIEDEQPQDETQDETMELTDEPEPEPAPAPRRPVAPARPAATARPAAPAPRQQPRQAPAAASAPRTQTRTNAAPAQRPQQPVQQQRRPAPAPAGRVAPARPAPARPAPAAGRRQYTE